LKHILIIFLFLALFINSSKASLFSNKFYYACSGKGTKFVGNIERVYWDGIRYVGLDKEKIYFFWSSIGNGKKKFLREEKLSKIVNDNPDEKWRFDGLYIDITKKGDLVTKLFTYGKNNQVIKFKVRKKNNSLIELAVNPDENSEMRGMFKCKKTSKNKMR